MYVDIVISNIFHLNKHFFFLSFSCYTYTYCYTLYFNIENFILYVNLEYI